MRRLASEIFAIGASMVISIVLTALIGSATASARELVRAASLIDAGQAQQAVALLEGVAQDPALRGECLVLLTQASTLAGDHEKAVEYGEEAVEASPQSSAAHYRYAVALREHMTHVGKLKAMGLVGKYKKVLAEAIDLDPGNVDARGEEIIDLISGPGIAGGSTDKAKAKIAELRLLDPRRAMTLEVAALRKEGKRNEALAVQQALVKSVPEERPARLQLALLLQEAMRYPEADVHLELLKGVSDPAVSLSATYQLARSGVLGGFDQQRAIALLADFIEARPAAAASLPSVAAAYWRKGQAHEQLGDLGEARRCFEKALALEPENEEAKKALKALPKG